MKTVKSAFHFIMDESLFNENINDLLFFDIETTGFSAKNTVLYMVGVGYFSDNSWIVEQFLAQTYEDEIQLITRFFDILNNYKLLIHFNGDGFDIPYIAEKCKKYNIDTECLSRIKSFDIYKAISPYRKIFPLGNLKQKTVESFLNVSREDELDGGKLIEVYHKYVKIHDNENEKLLLCHNHDDIEGLIRISPVLYYVSIFKGQYDDYSIEYKEYKSGDAKDLYELNIILIYRCKVNIPFSFNLNNLYFKIYGNKLYISVKGIKGELKYYFKDYKNYYYLPLEDMAVHKSVASYVDKEYRQKATPSDCYIRKEGVFFPAFSAAFPELFKSGYKDKESFLLYSDGVFKDKSFLRRYIDAILSCL